jgi:hypothetical protein
MLDVAFSWLHGTKNVIDSGHKGEHDPCDEMNGRRSLVFTHPKKISPADPPYPGSHTGKEQQRIIGRAGPGPCMTGCQREGDELGRR